MEEETKYAISLAGATKGRRAGFLTAQQKAAQIALNLIKDTEEGLRVFRAIMDMEDRT